MKDIYIGIGSNLGDRLRNCNRAVKEILAYPYVEFKSLSPWYLTEPVGMISDRWFVNGVLSIKSYISALELLKILSRIESNMGRRRDKGNRYQSRTIDLDILFYGMDIVNEPELKIPHPEIKRRRFVLKPLSDISPMLIHPVEGLTIKEMLENIKIEGQAIFLLTKELEL